MNAPLSAGSDFTLKKTFCLFSRGFLTLLRPRWSLYGDTRDLGPRRAFKLRHFNTPPTNDSHFNRGEFAIVVVGMADENFLHFVSGLRRPHMSAHVQVSE